MHYSTLPPLGALCAEHTVYLAAAPTLLYLLSLCPQISLLTQTVPTVLSIRFLLAVLRGSFTK